MTTRLIRSDVSELDEVGSGTTAERPPNPAPGQLYYDTTIGREIVWDGSAWVVIGPAAGGSGEQLENVLVTVNGQTAFTLSQLPLVAANVKMYVNGVLADFGLQYTVVGTAVTWLDVGFTLAIGDRAIFDYNF